MVKVTKKKPLFSPLDPVLYSAVLTIGMSYLGEIKAKQIFTDPFPGVTASGRSWG